MTTFILLKFPRIRSKKRITMKIPQNSIKNRQNSIKFQKITHNYTKFHKIPQNSTKNRQNYIISDKKAFLRRRRSIFDPSLALELKNRQKSDLIWTNSNSIGQLHIEPKMKKNAFCLLILHASFNIFFVIPESYSYNKLLADVES